MEIKFFEVTAKCGHVCRGRYYAGKLYVRAENRGGAVAKARLVPRVKHDQKQAILAVNEIGYVEYRAGVAAYRANPHFRCRSVFEQSLCYTAIAGDIHLEPWREKGMPANQSRWSVKQCSERKYKCDFSLRLWRKGEKYGHDYTIEMEAV
jgi:hypothetical protein